MIFSDVIEAIKGFSIEEKLQIQLLLQQYLTEEENSELNFSENIWHVKIEANIKNNLSKDSAVDILQLRGVDGQKLVRKIGECSSEIMEEIAAAIAVVVEYNE